MTDTPEYLHAARLDDLARMLTELASEVWVLRDRNLVLESLLTNRGIFGPGDIDREQLTEELATRVREERSAFVRRVFGATLAVDARTAAALLETSSPNAAR